MATKRKSIIEEALLEAKSLEDALKANTKEILATHMKQEIETIVESSLKEQEDEELEIDIEGSDENEEEMPGDDIVTGDDSEEIIDLDAEIADEEVDSELELDLDLDLPDAVGELDIDVAELPMDLGGDEIDLTGASDDEVLKVFKAMGDDDEVEVIKDEDGIHLTDNETGAEYYIKESEELEEGEDELCEGCGSQHEEDTIYEIELDEDVVGVDQPESAKALSDYEDEDGDLDEMWGAGKHEYKRRDGHRLGDVDGHYKDYESPFGGNKHDYKRRDGHKIGDVGGGKYGKGGHYKDYELDEDRIQRHQKGGYQRKSGAKVGSNQASPYGVGRRSESRKSRKSISERRKTPKNVSKIADSKIMKEYKELKSKNEEYKGALKVFKDKLNEVALFNTNLAYVNRLFTEHSTTKKEKMSILKRFDEADSVKGSKSIYKSIKSELDSKTPITESVEKKVNKTVKSSASDLNESTAYVDPQIVAIKDLMKRIS